VPVLGKLFSSSMNIVARTERLILITPRIISDSPSTSLSKRVLKGAVKDIVKNSDQRLLDGSDEIELLARRQTQAVNGESPLKKPIDVFKNTVLSPDNQPNRVVKTKLSDLTIIPALKKKDQISQSVNKPIVQAKGDTGISVGTDRTDHAMTVSTQSKTSSGWGVGVIDNSASKWKEAVH